MARVLLVDDEDLIRKVVRVILEAEGHEVTEAPDGDSALKAVHEEEPDAVVLDLVMPGVDGLDVCRRIRAGRPDAKVLVLTSVPRDEAEEQARSAGADDVMMKPFSALQLLDRLSNLLNA